MNIKRTAETYYAARVLVYIKEYFVNVRDFLIRVTSKILTIKLDETTVVQVVLCDCVTGERNKLQVRSEKSSSFGL